MPQILAGECVLLHLNSTCSYIYDHMNYRIRISFWDSDMFPIKALTAKIVFHKFLSGPRTIDTWWKAPAKPNLRENFYLSAFTMKISIYNYVLPMVCVLYNSYRWHLVKLLML